MRLVARTSEVEELEDQEPGGTPGAQLTAQARDDKVGQANWTKWLRQICSLLKTTVERHLPFLRVAARGSPWLLGKVAANTSLTPPGIGMSSVSLACQVDSHRSSTRAPQAVKITIKSSCSTEDGP